jgi:glucose-6-phosphate isomerase
MTVASPLTASLVSRIWARDTSAFLPKSAKPADHDGVRKRLGWLDAPSSMTARLGEVGPLVDALRRQGRSEIYLLGMGGSSLCAEVLARVAGTPAKARLAVLDTTDEYAITATTSALVPAHSCFIVASKSGSTVEVTALERHFWSVMARARGGSAGDHFVAITDPGTALVELANARGYRHTFLNPPEIGGRFSALSLFGLVPAAMLGWNPADLLAAGHAMAEACRTEGDGNPGLALGAFMANAHAAQRDKLTVMLPPAIDVLGLWIEQLVAESTGKDGRGLLPVVGEGPADMARYGPDRCFVVYSMPGADDSSGLARQLEAAGHPVFRITTTPGGLGGEFFRWEFATAVAGAAIGVNPFDEPGVRGAKALTGEQLAAYGRDRAFVLDPPLETDRGFSVRRVDGETARARRYVAVLDYLGLDAATRSAVAEGCAALRSRGHTVVTHGVGPRYLHSTGQYHKDGPNTGVFLLLTGADRTSTPVPEMDYAFSVLKYAQALGDFGALKARNRTAHHYHLPGAPTGLDVVIRDFLDRLER